MWTAWATIVGNGIYYEYFSALVLQEVVGLCSSVAMDSWVVEEDQTKALNDYGSCNVSQSYRQIGEGGNLQIFLVLLYNGHSYLYYHKCDSIAVQRGSSASYIMGGNVGIVEGCV